MTISLEIETVVVIAAVGDYFIQILGVAKGVILRAYLRLLVAARFQPRLYCPCLIVAATDVTPCR
jgi:hypothetical protein